MSKYRLKKDLPFAKAGATVSFTETQIIIQMDNSCHKHYYGRNDLAYLLSEGWIEEVRPRTYKLGLNKDGTFAFIWDFEGNGYDAQRQYPAAEIIIVREVIE